MKSAVSWQKLSSEEETLTLKSQTKELGLSISIIQMPAFSLQWETNLLALILQNSFVGVLQENHIRPEKEPHTTTAVLKICPESFWNIVKTSTVVSHKGAYKNGNNREKQIRRPSFLWCCRQQKQNLHLLQRHCTKCFSYGCNML